MANRRPDPRGGRPRNIRPGQRGGTGRARQTAEEARPRPRFTNRAAILLVVFAVLVVSYASSMRAYLQQRLHIDDLHRQIAASQADIADAQREKRRWQDPAYVEQQARERFGWVLPGETAYQVLDANGNPLTRDDELTDPSTVAPPKPQAWWSKVYDSVDAADHPEKRIKPKPATKITPDPAP
ncbi:MAG: septum formation initiator family protein [Nocardioidaceae bacterium]|nr:septum formation initiator family protein [Nocardioidaceae bacterium]